MVREGQMKVKILYFSGCPNWETALDRTRTALAELGCPDASILLQDVGETPHLPREWAGSPTVMIDDQDPFAADPGPAPARDACRIYRTGAGFEGAPSTHQLRTAFRVAFESSKNTKGAHG